MYCIPVQRQNKLFLVCHVGKESRWQTRGRIRVESRSRPSSAAGPCHAGATNKGLATASMSFPSRSPSIWSGRRHSHGEQKPHTYMAPTAFRPTVKLRYMYIYMQIRDSSRPRIPSRIHSPPLQRRHLPQPNQARIALFQTPTFIPVDPASLFSRIVACPLCPLEVTVALTERLEYPLPGCCR